MEWQLIETAPSDGKYILVAFKGQFKWTFYVAPAHGIKTGNYMPFAPPTHWTPIISPQD